MLNNYGYEGADWEKAKAQARDVLIEVARRKDKITYSELATEITAINIEAHDSRMNHLLGEISSEEDAQDRGMLTAIVVHKFGDLRPGPGFYDLAKSLGKDTSDKDFFWISEIKTVHDYWANQHK